MLVKRDPLTAVLRDINSVFGDFPSLIRSGRSWSPAVDVHEDKGQITIEVELPGIDSKNVEIFLDGNLLTIKGEKTHEVKDKEYHIVERYQGSFVRSFTLPTYINSSSISATYDKGTLLISLPKKPEVVPQKIEINISE